MSEITVSIRIRMVNRLHQGSRRVLDVPQDARSQSCQQAESGKVVVDAVEELPTSSTFRMKKWHVVHVSD
jgi:hypothetical protein